MPSLRNVARFDDTVEDALRQFQSFYRLPVSGTVNEETLRLINTPRCGVPDMPGLHARFNVQCPWTTRTLRYHMVQFLTQVPQADQSTIFIRCVRQWADAVGITITEGREGSEIQGLIEPIDGPGGVFAETYTPCSGALSGDVYFDEYDVWSVDTPVPGNFVDYVSIALHEIGHAYGMLHSADRNAVMFAYFELGEMRRDLTQDDLDGIHELYPR